MLTPEFLRALRVIRCKCRLTLTLQHCHISMFSKFMEVTVLDAAESNRKPVCFSVRLHFHSICIVNLMGHWAGISSGHNMFPDCFSLAFMLLLQGTIVTWLDAIIVVCKQCLQAGYAITSCLGLLVQFYGGNDVDNVRSSNHKVGGIICLLGGNITITNNTQNQLISYFYLPENFLEIVVYRELRQSSKNCFIVSDQIYPSVR